MFRTGGKWGWTSSSALPRDHRCRRTGRLGAFACWIEHLLSTDMSPLVWNWPRLTKSYTLHWPVLTRDVPYPVSTSSEWPRSLVAIVVHLSFLTTLNHTAIIGVIKISTRVVNAGVNVKTGHLALLVGRPSIDVAAMLDGGDPRSVQARQRRQH